MPPLAVIMGVPTWPGDLCGQWKVPLDIGSSVDGIVSIMVYDGYSFSWVVQEKMLLYY